MRVDYIDPFIDSAISILKETVSKNVKKGEVILKAHLAPMLGIAIIIGLAGQVKGRVIIDMKKETGLAVASIMNQEEMKSLDELVCATLAELANMIVASAVTKLHELGFKFDLTPPAIISGDNLKIPVKPNEIEAMFIPLEIPQGIIEINVALKEDSGF